MKKVLSFILVLCMVASMFTFNVFASEEIKVTIDGKAQSYDVMPIIENGRTLVPLRAIFEALNAEIEWDGNTKTVTSTKNSTVVKLQIGSNIMYVNGVEKILDVPPCLINSRTLVPVRAISEAFGCKVDWDGENRNVIIEI